MVFTTILIGKLLTLLRGWYDEFGNNKTYEKALEAGLLEALKSIK